MVSVNTYFSPPNTHFSALNTHFPITRKGDFSGPDEKSRENIWRIRKEIPTFALFILFGADYTDFTDLFWE